MNRKPGSRIGVVVALLVGLAGPARAFENVYGEGSYYAVDYVYPDGPFESGEASGSSYELFPSHYDLEGMVGLSLSSSPTHLAVTGLIRNGDDESAGGEQLVTFSLSEPTPVAVEVSAYYYDPPGDPYSLLNLCRADLQGCFFRELWPEGTEFTMEEAGSGSTYEKMIATPVSPATELGIAGNFAGTLTGTGQLDVYTYPSDDHSWNEISYVASLFGVLPAGDYRIGVDLSLFDPQRGRADVSLAMQVVPEPGTGLLLVVGLAGLAARGRAPRARPRLGPKSDGPPPSAT